MAIEGQEQAAEQPGGAPPAAGAEKPTEQQGEQKPAAVAGAPPAEKPRDYDREIAGIRADLIKERKARQQYETDLAAAKADVERERKRARLLATDNPQSDQEVEEAQIKQRLEALGYPMLTKEDLGAIREFRATKGTLQETTSLMWQRHNQQVTDDIRSTLEGELGGKLSNRQMQRAVAEYVREAENNPEFLARHEKGDKTLAVEFVKQLVEDWFEPARRKVTQQESQRFRAVPSGKDRGIITHGEKKIDVTDDKAVEDLLVKSYRERNGEFTGRR